MIVFSDFDRTLYSHADKAGFRRNLESIQEFRQKGNLFCIATGRSRGSLGRVWPDYEEYLDYMILDNGAICLDKNREVMLQEAVPLDVAGKIVEKILAKYSEEVEFVFYHDAQEWQKLDQDVTKMRCWTRDVETATVICEEINAEFGDRVKSFVARTAVMTNVVEWVDNPDEYRSFVDIMSVKAGKYNTIRKLSEGYPGERIVTVGDDTNDLEMIQGFDGYAMRNSVPEVLAVVNPGHIVESVAELLEKLVNCGSR